MMLFELFYLERFNLFYFIASIFFTASDKMLNAPTGGPNISDI
jgi:hypothetical protein